jgi:hypothetical protein
VGIEETRGVKARVRRLLEIAAYGRRRRFPNNPTIARILPAASVGLLLGAALAVAGNPQILIAVHSFLERAVKLLS